MKARGMFATVNDEIGEIIVADVNADTIRQVTGSSGAELERLIAKD